MLPEQDYLAQFNGDTEQPEYINMAKNLTKKLKRQGTDDSYVRQQAHDIAEEQTIALDINENDINTEIVGMLAEEILMKTEFFGDSPKDFGWFFGDSPKDFSGNGKLFGESPKHFFFR